MIDNLFRLDYTHCLDLLRERLSEKAPSRIQLLTGPRQVGKTTLLLQLAESLEDRALYAAADSPEAALPGWWERLWARAEEKASENPQGAILLLDEAHKVPQWARRLKGELDRLRRLTRAIHIVATGSSALQMTWGSKESLAGRFERLAMSHWSAMNLVDRFAISPQEATDITVSMGTYPGSMDLRHDLARWRAYLRDAIVEPAIARDILELTDVRKPGLLRQLFATCMTLPARIVSLNKLQGLLQDRGALETIAHYLHLLEEAFLLIAAPKYSPKPHRLRASPPKIVILNNALLAAADPAGIPDPVTDADRYGRWVENACLAHCWNTGHHVSYWREEPLEVDAVIDGPWGAWALEVKSGSLHAGGLNGLLEFTRRHPKYRPLVLCDPGQEDVARRAGLHVQPWKEFLLQGPAGST